MANASMPNQTEDLLAAHGEELARLYAQGETSLTLAERYATNKNVVLRVLHRMGIAPRPATDRTRARLVQDQQAPLLSKLYLNGMSLDALSSRFGIHRSTIRKILARNGVPPRYRRGPPPMSKVDPEAARTILSGIYQKDAGELLGVSKRTIQRWEALMGAPARHQTKTYKAWRERKQAELIREARRGQGAYL